MKQYLLSRNDSNCKNCGTCSRLLPDFIKKHNGSVIISDHSYAIEEIRIAANSLIEACPQDAISIIKLSKASND